MLYPKSEYGQIGTKNLDSPPTSREVQDVMLDEIMKGLEIMQELIGELASRLTPIMEDDRPNAPNTLMKDTVSPRTLRERQQTEILSRIRMLNEHLSNIAMRVHP